MLPGYVAGHYDYDEAHIDLGALARFANARFYHSAVTGLDLNGKRVLCDNRPPVLLELLDHTGSTPNTSLVGATGNVVPVKPINNFRPLGGTQRPGDVAGRPMRIAAVGAGAGGVEILLAIQHGWAGSGRQREPWITSNFICSATPSTFCPPTTRKSAPPSRTCSNGMVLHLGEWLRRWSPAF